MKHTLSMLMVGVTFPVWAQSADPTNFIVINLDDVGYGDFSFNGAIGYETPNIDQMAAEGMRFTHFLVGQPISGASRAGLLTGCYPNRIGFAGAPGPNSPYGIHENEITLGELVKQKGYRVMPLSSFLCRMGLMSIMDYPTRMICGLIILSKEKCLTFPICPPLTVIKFLVITLTRQDLRQTILLVPSTLSGKTRTNLS